MVKSAFFVPDIVCDGCANSIKNSLAKVTGIDKVDVDVHLKSVTVEHHEGVTVKQLVEKFDDIGFPVAYE